MIDLIVNMTAHPEKRRELLQTLHELTRAMRQEHGFIDAQIGINAKDLNRITFTEMWKTQEDMNVYMQESRYFPVLQGALKVLTASATIELSDNAHQSTKEQRHTIFSYKHTRKR